MRNCLAISGHSKRESPKQKKITQVPLFLFTTFALENLFIFLRQNLFQIPQFYLMHFAL